MPRAGLGEHADGCEAGRRSTNSKPSLGDTFAHSAVRSRAGALQRREAQIRGTADVAGLDGAAHSRC